MSLLEELNKAVTGVSNVVHDITGSVQSTVERVGETIGQGGGLVSVGVKTPGIDAAAQSMVGAVDRMRVAITLIAVALILYFIFRGKR